MTFCAEHTVKEGKLKIKAYLAIKFHEDCENKELIESVSEQLHNTGIETTVMACDYENWGKTSFEPEELMKLTFKIIDDSEALVIKFSEKGIGLEAGYAYSRGIPVIVKIGSDIPTTMQGITKHVIFYNTPQKLAQKFKEPQIC